MKRAYTQFHSKLVKDAKTYRLDVDEYFSNIDWKTEYKLQIEKRGYEEGTRMALRNYCLSIYERRIHKGDAIHFFMRGDRRFCDWLVSCTKDILALDTFAAIKELMAGKVAILHLPTESGLSSVSFGFQEVYIGTSATDEPVFNAPHNDKHTKSTFLVLLPSREKEWFYTFNYEPDREIDLKAICQTFTSDDVDIKPAAIEGDYCLRLVAGLLLYCDAFPDMIKEGLPEDLRHPAHHAFEEVKNVGISPKVLAYGTHASPSAHYRVGHFRSLKSEFFTKKRFKTVFVHGTFVKGTAKTVESV